MTSFGWKRKKPTLSHQNFDAADDEDEESEGIDWLTGSKRVRGGALEDSQVKSDRLKAEGEMLAENGRYWQAIRLWDEALTLVPDNAIIHEMKAQAFLELREDFEAVRSAEEAVRCDPMWSIGRQTLARSQLNIGEAQLALKNFCKALHLEPWSKEIREEDIPWTMSILEKAKDRDIDSHNDHDDPRSRDVRLRDASM